LTGTIAAWLAVARRWAACKLGVYLHGMAGDLSEAEGELSMTPATWSVTWALPSWSLPAAGKPSIATDRPKNASEAISHQLSAESR
jgi:hypothetical protein